MIERSRRTIMEISYYFKNLEPSDAIKEYIQEKVGRLDKRFQHIESVDARMAVQKKDQIFELTIHADSKVFHVKKDDKNLYAAIDIGSDALSKQVDRFHKKREDHMPRPGRMMSKLCFCGHRRLFAIVNAACHQDVDD